MMSQGFEKFPDLFKVHLIKSDDGVGASTLRNAIALAADKKVSMNDEFSICIVTYQGKEVSLQVWDDTPAAKASPAYHNAEIELFILDLTDPDGALNIERTLREHKTANPLQTIRLLIANKIDLVDEEELDVDAMEKIAQHYNLDGFAAISAQSLDDMSDLVNEITRAGMEMRKYFKKQQEFRAGLVAEIFAKIGELKQQSTEGKEAAVVSEKITGLSKLATDLGKETSKPVADIIAETRKTHPKLDDSATSKATKCMLDRFIKESRTVEANTEIKENKTQESQQLREQ